MADNTLWDGHVLEKPRPSDRQTAGIESFNDFIARDSRVEKVHLAAARRSHHRHEEALRAVGWIQMEGGLHWCLPNADRLPFM